MTSPFTSASPGSASPATVTTPAAGVRRELVTRLGRRADVLIENAGTRPGPGDPLHQRLRTRRTRGRRAGYDQIAQGEAGLMSLTGEPGAPTKLGTPIAGLLAASSRPPHGLLRRDRRAGGPVRTAGERTRTRGPHLPALVDHRQGISATELYRRGLVHRLVPDGRDLTARLAGVVADGLHG